MSALTFDTLSIARGLEEGGLSKQQAEAVTTAIRKAQDAHLDELATKGDIKRLEHKVEFSEQRLLLRLGSLIIGIAGLMIAYLELRGGTP